MERWPLWVTRVLLGLLVLGSAAAGALEIGALWRASGQSAVVLLLAPVVALPPLVAGALLWRLPQAGAARLRDSLAAVAAIGTATVVLTVCCAGVVGSTLMLLGLP